MPLKSRFLLDAVLSAKRQGQAMAFGTIIAIYNDSNYIKTL
jgi:hypothetical protein